MCLCHDLCLRFFERCVRTHFGLIVCREQGASHVRWRPPCLRLWPWTRSWVLCARGSVRWGQRPCAVHSRLQNRAPDTPALLWQWCVPAYSPPPYVATAWGVARLSWLAGRSEGVAALGSVAPAQRLYSCVEHDSRLVTPCSCVWTRESALAWWLHFSLA